MANNPGRRPVSALSALHVGDIRNEPEVIRKTLRDQHPDENYGLGVARVVMVDYEEHYVTLRTLIGSAQEFERVPVPITYPGAGARHFFGAMPEVGDYCIVGWMPQESSGKESSKTPVILSWIVPGVWPGRDWLTTAGFTEDEHDSGTSRNREEVKGVFDRVRHKLRHIQPGNIVASSSQGADLVLDENVILANRRGNEIKLRDADQAILFRALQQFSALAGTRVYAGMVQRDALRLPTTMFSDGFQWDATLQAVGDEPVAQVDLPPHPTIQDGWLTPADIFHRPLPPGETLSKGSDVTPDYLDPYTFLRNGGYIDENGVALSPVDINDAVYAGKNLYRVLAGTRDNGVLSPEAGALTEHRIEVAHTSDGRLPVTEQTDGFDAERLPPSDPSTPGSSPNAPYIEWVLGSVVGNDPYSARGRKEYGLPLVVRVFDGTGGLSPMIEPARIVSSGKSGATPLGEQAATLFKLTPPVGGLAPTFWSVNKKGQARAFFSGAPGEASLDVAVAGNMRLAVGGGLDLQLKGGIHLGTLSKNSLRLRSEQGPVAIYGGGSAKDEEATMERAQGTSGGEDNIPAVDIRARTNARLWADRMVLVKGKKIELNASSVVVNGLDQIEMVASKQITQSTEDMKTTTNGKRVDTFLGPKNLLPTSGALHERSYNPMYPGLTCEEVTYLWGDRTERFNLGNHTTTVLVGNMTYQTTLGMWRASAGLNALEVDTFLGVRGRAVVGNASLTAVAGAAQMTGVVSATMESVGPATVRSGTMVRLAAPPSGPDIGPILTAGSLEPFTLLPYLTWGMGAKTVLISPI